MNKNTVYLEKRLKVLLPKGGTKQVNKMLVATIGKNFEAIGYAFSPELFRALSKLSEAQITAFYKETLPVLKKMRGGHRAFRPMYPNFPEQVINMSDFELYWNAMCHYWSFWAKDLGLTDKTWLPEYEKEERMPLTEPVKLDMLQLGTKADFNRIFTVLVEAKSSISEADKQVIQDFILSYKDKVVDLLPDTIQTKEQLAFVAGLLLKHTNVAMEMLRYIKTPTDVLRVAAAFSEGDVSLATVTKFKNFSRSQRRFLLGLLDKCNTNLAEEMVKYQSRWVRLGERLHPREYSTQFPRSASAFSKLRSGKKINTFNSKVEAALADENLTTAVKLLTTRPGEFARRLDHILRLNARGKSQFVKKFLDVADKVSTNVLLQLYTHFKTRGETDFRAVFPKGNLAKIHVLETAQVNINKKFCLGVAEKIRGVLIKRFSKLEKLGSVSLDEKLKDYLVPFSQRSASKALKTLVRGSRISLDGDYDTVRFFIWWKNKNGGWGGRVDIDLTASILTDKWEYLSDISYYNLKDFAGHHSGDITDAPKGAAEFIDISLDKVVQRGARYIVMGIYSYTNQPYCDLPECFAGWMGRKSPNSGEIFEAKTVKNKIDVSSDTQVCLPLIIDAVERKVIWTDLALKQRPTWTNARNNSKNIALVCRAMAELRKPNLYDLFSMHVEARGKLTKNPSKAKTVFSAETTPFDVDTILTEFV